MPEQYEALDGVVRYSGPCMDSLPDEIADWLEGQGFECDGFTFRLHRFEGVTGERGYSEAFTELELTLVFDA